MESWVLEGDSYSFLPSAPHNFNLQHLDGPNRVEIFDITSVPSHRSGISETTCLCDIFGDDCESPSLSSSPASTSFLKKDVDEQLPVEDANDSSGSYHTANGSEHQSDGSDTFEDSKDTKDLLFSETGESNTPASDLTLPNDKQEVTSANGSTKPAGNWQESHLSQDTSLGQVENSSDPQLITSTSEFRDTNIRVTGSTQGIISPELLSENKGIRDQSHATSSELWETDSTQEIITPDLRHITKQVDASSSEEKENDSTEKIITPDSSHENRGTTASEVRETDSTQKNKYYKERESTFSENRDSDVSLSNLASEDSFKVNNVLGCSGEEEEKNSLHDILPTENISILLETVKNDCSVALTNISNDGSGFTPLKKAASDPPAKDETHDLREMSAPLEYENIPNKLAYVGVFLCDDKAGLVEDTVPPPTYVEGNTETGVESMPQHFTISSETRETVILHEHRTVPSFSDTTDGLISCVISKLSSPSSSSVDVNSSEPPIIIHSPVGFTLCPSPEPMNKIWSAGTADLASTTESTESDYRLTPTDKGSISSFDLKLCPTPEPGSINSAPENRQNVFMCELIHAASSPGLRSASCSPEMKTMTCSSLTQHSKSPQIKKKAPQNNFTSQYEVLAQTHEVDGIIHAEGFISTARPSEEVADVNTPTICNLSSTQGGISSPSTTLPRDTVSLDLKGTRYTESVTPDILPTNEITNVAISSKFSSTDRCIISPHSSISIQRGTESPDIFEIRSEESSISTIPPANEIADMAISNLSSGEGSISTSPSALIIPRDTESPDVVGTRPTESSMSTTLPTKDIENVVSSPILHLSSAKGGIPKPFNFSAPRDTAPSDVDGIISVKGYESSTILTNETKLTAISPISNNLPTASNLSIPRDAMFPEVEGTRYAQSSVSTMFPIMETENVVITPITHLSSVEGGISISTSPLSILRDTISPDIVGTRCGEISMSTISPTNDTTNMVISPISNHSSTEGGTSRPSSTISISRNTASPEIDEIRCMEIPTSTIILTNELTNMSNSHNNLSLTGSISKPPSNLSIPRDTTCLHAQEAKYMDQSNEISANESTNMATSPIFHCSTTEGGIFRPPSSSSISEMTASTDVDGLRCEEGSSLSILPTNEAPIMSISPVINISPTEGGLSNPPSTLSIPGGTTSPNVEGTRYTEISNEIPTNETTNMAISPISHGSTTEGGISRPPSASSISEITASTDVDGLRCEEGSTLSICPTDEAPILGISPVIKMSPTEGGLSNPPSTLSIPGGTTSPNVEGTRYTEISNEIPTNETTNMAISPISHCSTTEGGISRPPSASSISEIRASTDVDELRCVEGSTLSILPTNEAPILGISPVIKMSPTEGGQSNPPSALSIPRGTMSANVEGTRYTEIPNEIPTNEITISFTSNLSSTEGGISKPSSTLSIPRATMSPDVDGIRCMKSSASTVLPTNDANSPVYNFSSTEGGISRQPSNLSIPKHTVSPDVEGTRYSPKSNEIQTNENKNMASSISNLTTPSIILADRVSSPKIRYRKSPERFDDHVTAPEMCIPLGCTDNHLSTTVHEKVDLPLMVPVGIVSTDDTSYKMSLKSCSLPQDDCIDIASIPCSQANKISDSLPEPPAPILSVKQIKEGWERKNESILNSLNPWQTHKKILTVSTAKESKEGNDSGGEMLERESVGSEKTFGQMALRPGESPSVLHSNNHSMYEGQSHRNKGWSGERVIQEELTLEKGVGNIAECSYKGEQVELSFSTRNRKGPANHSPAPSSRDPKSGIQPRYFESPLATHRQQSLLRAHNLQKENKTGARRVQSTSQSNHCGAGRLSSETSSMGSEFDDADREVKWFADQAFRSLSSPQVDYLDVYNSSYGSSTNVSQPSTVDSPGSATWISYADLHDSLHENDDVLCHTSSFLPHGSLDPAKHFEMGSFECVDVALESKEETIRGKRTVPKRQIQFKRRNFDELKSTESEGIAMDSSSTQTCSRDTFVRQYSTPASMQEELSQGEHEFQTGKEMLQKSASLDESSPRNKMASSVIKSVLSKKMDTTTKESSRSEPHEDKNRHIETLAAAESSNAERQSSSLPCECSLSSEPFSSKEKRSPHLQKRSCRPKVPPKPVFNANCLPPSNSPTGVAFHCKTSVKDQIKPTTVDGFTNKTSKKHTFGNREKEASKLEEKYNNDSGNASNRTPNCTAICVASTQSRMTNSDNKHPMTPETHKQQEGSSSMFLSKTPEITLKSCTINDKNKSSLKASFCPELEITKDTICKPLLEETIEEQMKLKTGIEADKEEDNEKNKAKSVIHKVRDVRKLVKNTYNLSFKASNNTHHEEDIVPDKQKEMQVENPHPLHIECKAISWKDKTAPCNKSATQQDVAHTAENSKMPQTDSVIRRNVGITKITTKTSLSSVQHSDMPGLDKCKDISKSGNCEQSTKLEMPSRSPSKEISTLVFLQDGTPKSVQKPTSPASPNAKTINSSHSVSMLRKEKGMQADIGVCDVLSEGVGVKPKHINRLEVPLQTYASEATSSECQKMKNDDADLPPKQKTALNSSLQTREHTLQGRSSPKPKEVRILPNGKVMDNQANLLQPPKEQEITVAASSKAEVSAFSSNTKIHAMPVTTSKEIELPIQVRSISSDRPKPSVLPKPSYKQPVAEIRSTSNDFPKTDIPPTTSILKEQTHLKSDIKIIETSATVIHKEESTNTASSNTKTLAVPAVSSHKPQTIPVTTMSSSAQKSTATTGRQEISITSVQNSSNCQQQNIQEQVKEATSYAANYQNLPVNSEANTYMQPTVTTLSNKQLHTDDFHFPTSDDPPSYDERESFSPLHLSDLPPRRQHRYHPTSKHSVCSCTSCTHPQFGQPYLGSQNQTPPAPRSPGQVISYPGAPPQAQVRPHQCRPDGQHTNYPSASPKSIVQQAPAMIQPMHHPYTCPAPAIQPYVNEQQQPSTQHMDRRSGNQRSPQAPSGATYREHSRSPNIAAQDPRSQFFNPQELPPAFGHDFGSDGPGGGGVLYPENASGLGYGQGPRRVLLDPETGKYFYIEVPMQPLRKMLFDPEIGQYVEVLMPQQAMSNSSMYPPTAAPYQGPYHGQGLYTSQYLPYTMPPHPQSAQQPRHPEPSVPTSLHQHTMGYGSSASQMPKSDIKGHPSLDQSYLESMYYIPTGMNASPNSTPSDCCHKPTTNIPASGGRRA